MKSQGMWCSGNGTVRYVEAPSSIPEGIWFSSSLIFFSFLFSFCLVFFFFSYCSFVSFLIVLYMYKFFSLLPLIFPFLPTACSSPEVLRRGPVIYIFLVNDIYFFTRLTVPTSRMSS